MARFEPSFQLYFGNTGGIFDSPDAFAKTLFEWNPLRGDLFARFPNQEDTLLMEARQANIWLAGMGVNFRTSDPVILRAAAHALWQKAAELPPAVAQREAWELSKATRAKAPRAAARTKARI